MDVFSLCGAGTEIEKILEIRCCRFSKNYTEQLFNTYILIFFAKVFIKCADCGIIFPATQLNIFRVGILLVKTYALMFYTLLGVNCVATEVKHRFSVRNFCCALFYFQEKNTKYTLGKRGEFCLLLYHQICSNQ